jgi:activator of HSP90 ATPase
MRKITSSWTSLETVSATPTRRQLISGAAIALGGLALGSNATWARVEDEISHAAESIHMEPVFTASRKRLYDTLTDAKQFNEVVKLGLATKSGMIKDPTPGTISREVGGTFALFGGFIVGRHLELVPNERIVQAWRVSYWDPGAFSIVKFVFADEGSGSKIVFDHGGFPKGDAGNLVVGWKGNYWEPLAKFLA